ncbi:PREDICTED: voltage-dependent calcium channel gamma-8 subunit [Nicrophorus vespilloides]|uniref:Voltage-dependent calcium channel gamma-8 subunit n=1 Tax=Nicrophorus vespilloides TaxID=110193 RepID=A0ABM1N7F5_NICVS|nr:PREDICTED: voltage-dependent calcium channel gamma-8 subunit [Nicrophorus vespilloides]
MQRSMGRGHRPNGEDERLGPLENNLTLFWILTPLAATVSLVVILLAIFTNQWLHTEEKMHNPSYNGTGDRDFLSKMTVSGLWTLCFTNPGETLYECIRIDYFTNEEYSPDPNDSTMAIPYAVTRSILFFASATCLLFAAYCCCIAGHCLKQRGLCIFISSVSFIVTGLVMLFGLIVYISIFKSEIGGKLRPRSQLQPPAFTYSYGFSFFLYVFGFICTQLTGVCSLHLVINKLQYEFRCEHLEDLKHGGGGGGAGGKLRQTMINYMPLDHNSYYPCRRHPQAYINTNSIHVPANYPSPVHQRRYFFSKENHESPCGIHHSVKDVATFYDFPPPPTISYRESNMRLFPRDITTNTVSTTADIIDDFIVPDDYSPSIQNEHEFVTFDLDQPLPLRVPSCVSINSKNGRSDTLRRTTPV